MAGTEVGSLYYDLDINDKNLNSQLDNADRKVKSFGDRVGESFAKVGQKMTDVGKTMTVGLTLPIVAGAAMAIKAASDLNETVNKIDVAFKDQAKTVKAWADTAITKMGLAKGSALDAAALFGDMSTAMGLNTKEAAKMSTNLVQLGADMASFKNVSFERTQTALAGVYTGETESLKQLGIIMTETNLQEFARAQGITKSLKEMTQAEKVQLRYAYVMSVTKNAQGDFNRTSDGTANQLRITQERFKELQADLGQRFLPVANKVLEFVQNLFKAFQELTPKQQNMILGALGIAAALGPVLIVLGNLIKLLGLIAAHPVIAALILLAALLIYLQVKFQIFTRAWEALMPVIQPVIAAFKEMFRILGEQLAPIIDFVKRNLDAFKTVGLILLGAVLLPIIGAIAVVIAVFAGLVGGLMAVIFVFNKVIQTISAVRNWFNDLQRKINEIASGAVNWLYDAGKNLIQGLINGIKNRFNDVKNTLGDLTKRMTSWKGPETKDKILLVKNAQLIMGGFVKGLESQYGLVRDSLGGLTNSLAGSVIKPTLSGGGAGLNSTSSGQVVNNAGTTVNIGTVNNKQDEAWVINRLDRNQQLESMGMSPL